MNAMLIILIVGLLLLAVAVTLYLQTFLEGKYLAKLHKRVRANLQPNAVPAFRSGLGKTAKTARQGLFSNLMGRFGKPAKSTEKLLFDRELPLLLELTALGMRAGLGFDQAFELYARRFPGPLADICQQKLNLWEKGLISREEGLRALAEVVGTPGFTRFTTITLRGLHYGASINQLLLELAQEQRRNYRAEREEEVSKAPVKMLIPTGVLILPAMLLLVLGPIMLQMMGRF